jgi:hypothetical protein
MSEILTSGLVNGETAQVDNGERNLPVFRQTRT